MWQSAIHARGDYVLMLIVTVPVDVLQHYDGIVHDHSDGQSESVLGHNIYWLCETEGRPRE
jgi:hypothetical protein